MKPEILCSQFLAVSFFVQKERHLCIANIIMHTTIASSERGPSYSYSNCCVALFMQRNQK